MQNGHVAAAGGDDDVHNNGINNLITNKRRSKSTPKHFDGVPVAGTRGSRQQQQQQQPQKSGSIQRTFSTDSFTGGAGVNSFEVSGPGSSGSSGSALGSGRRSLSDIMGGGGGGGAITTVGFGHSSATTAAATEVPTLLPPGGVHSLKHKQLVRSSSSSSLFSAATAGGGAGAGVHHRLQRQSSTGGIHSSLLGHNSHSAQPSSVTAGPVGQNHARGKDLYSAVLDRGSLDHGYGLGLTIPPSLKRRKIMLDEGSQSHSQSHGGYFHSNSSNSGPPSLGRTSSIGNSSNGSHMGGGSGRVSPTMSGVGTSAGAGSLFDSVVKSHVASSSSSNSTSTNTSSVTGTGLHRTTAMRR